MTISPRSAVLVRLLTGLWLGSWGVLSLATTGCEEVLGTGDLHDSTGGEAGPGDDDDDGDDASVPTDGGHVTGDATVPTDGSTLDAGDGGGGGGDGGSPEAAPPISSLPSCVTSPSANTCGATANEDCCAYLPVASGTYNRTYDGGAAQADPVTVTGYNLDVYEVTVGRMRAYATWLASDAGGAPAEGSGTHSYLNDGDGLDAKDGTITLFEPGWSTADNTNLTLGASANATFASPPSCNGTTYTTTPGADENRPMSCVNWYDAYAFCIWDGGFLPSEAEWELAAAGGAQQRIYPWGITPPDAQHATYGCTTAGCSPNIVGFASQGAGLYGQFDLMGNVAEWTLDDYASSYSHTESCTDCYEIAYFTTPNRVDRGGAYSDTLAQNYLYPWSRSSYAPASRSPLVGFRCARAPGK
jgi:sulfatase modifying factor 1